jgi:hypothetical protein
MGSSPERVALKLRLGGYEFHPIKALTRIRELKGYANEWINLVTTIVTLSRREAPRLSKGYRNPV